MRYVATPGEDKKLKVDFTDARMHRLKHSRLAMCSTRRPDVVCVRATS
jgi:hypothetical protein